MKHYLYYKIRIYYLAREGQLLSKIRAQATNMARAAHAILASMVCNEPVPIMSHVLNLNHASSGDISRIIPFFSSMRAQVVVQIHNYNKFKINQVDCRLLWMKNILFVLNVAMPCH